MATRSNIGIKNENQVEIIYCHWDGYPSNNGKILLDHYQNTTKMKELINLGDISSLERDIGVKQDFDSPNENMVIAYHRDREEDLSPAVHCDIKKACNEEYLYLWDINEEKFYYCHCVDGISSLKELTYEICNRDF